MKPSFWQLVWIWMRNEFSFPVRVIPFFFSPFYAWHDFSLQGIRQAKITGEGGKWTQLEIFRDLMLTPRHMQKKNKEIVSVLNAQLFKSWRSIICKREKLHWWDNDRGFVSCRWISVTLGCENLNFSGWKSTFSVIFVVSNVINPPFIVLTWNNI